MQTQKTHYEANSSRYRNQHSHRGGRPEMPSDPPRLPDGSIDYAFFKLRARRLRAAFLAETVAAARHELSRAIKIGIAAIHQLIHRGPMMIFHQRR
jgi:hypothetical protein